MKVPAQKATASCMFAQKAWPRQKQQRKGVPQQRQPEAIMYHVKEGGGRMILVTEGNIGAVKCEVRRGAAREHPRHEASSNTVGVPQSGGLPTQGG